MKPCRRVAVVGGGISGIIAIKTLKEEESIEPVCFERSSDVGGNWCYRPEDSDYDSETVMSTTTLLHSKEMGALSNYPFPDDTPNYMRHDELFKFLINLCNKYDFWKHIIRNREVISVKRAADYDDTGRWDVTIRNTQSQEVTAEAFDAVVMCTGLNSSPNMPTYPGMNKFKGRILHTQKLRTFESFMGENVVVVGAGCSAMDAAVEISSVSKKVYWSVRTPSWILSRVWQYGLPTDYVLFRRYHQIILDIFGTSFTSKLLQNLFITPRFNHEFYGINPKHPFLGKDPTPNDVISTKLLNGSVVLRKNIREIDEQGVIFEKEDKTTKVDTIVMGTGYRLEIPCLEEGILIREKGGKFHLYKAVFPPHLKHPTISFVHYFLPFSAGFPMCEMQCRWIAHVLSGKGTLPSEKEMRKEIESRYQSNAERFLPSDKMSQRLDYIPYMNSVASEIGVKPNLWKMAIVDPLLFIACFFGPCVSYQYRLVGPHKWDGARNAILTAPERVKAPLKQGKEVISQWDLRESHILLKVILMVLLFLVLFVPIDDPSVSRFFPALLGLHLSLVRGTGGKTVFYCFLPMCVASWFFFPSAITFLVIIQAAFVLMAN